MKTLQRFLSVMLCLALLCGSAAIGGEGVAEGLASLTVRASALSAEKQLDVTREEAVQWALANYTTVTGAYYDPDNYYGEGVSLAKNYIYYALGVRGSEPGGQIIFAEHAAAGAVRTQDILDHFEILDNTHDPLPGDMFVWDYYYNPYGDMLWTGEYGQIGVITAVSDTTYTAVNWNGWEGSTLDSASLVFKPHEAGMFTAGLHDFSALIRPQFKEAPILHQKGDVIELGSYPQTKETDSAVLDALNGKSVTWTAYTYYSGTGDRFDGLSRNAPYFMYYTDMEYEGVRYRGVKFTDYRPVATGLAHPARNSTETIQYKNGYQIDTVYWFRWEPLRWRVLDPDAGLVLCETVIDSQPYHHTAYLSETLNGSEIYRGTTLGLPDYDPFASDYETSGLRTWLQGHFFNAAFNEAQQSKILDTERTGIPFALDAAGHPEFNKDNQFTVKDKIILLSDKEVFYSDYFAGAASRNAQGSDYAKCQGLDVSASGGSAAWWLFPSVPYGSGQVYFAKPNSEDPVVDYVDVTGYGVRPAMQVELSSIPSKDPDEPDEPDAFGYCGDRVYDVQWYWYEKSGRLKIEGTGKMDSYTLNDTFGGDNYWSVPWARMQKQIRSVVIVEGVKSIGSYAFYGCTNLTSVTISDSVGSIGNHAFGYCNSLTSITIPDSVGVIGVEAFQLCTGLTSVTIGKGVIAISRGAFWGCNKLTSVYISDLEAWCKIHFDAETSNPFYNHANNFYLNGALITELVIPNSVTSILRYAFYGCAGLTSVTIPDSVDYIGIYAFRECVGLTSLTISNSVQSIREETFGLCAGLTSVTIPNSVTSIGSRAFAGCHGLTSVTIPDSVTSIDWKAFEQCYSLTSVTIPDSVTTIDTDAFLNCTGLTAITVDASNPNFSSDSSGVLYNKNKTVLIQYPIGNKRVSFSIPDSVTSIGKDAFAGCTELTSMTIPDSVTDIGDNAFIHCTGLTSVTIGTGVTSISEASFYGCTGLTSMIIPDSVTSILRYAFYGCTGLTSVAIGTSVRSIGEYAFAGCTGLTSVTIPDSVTSILRYAFGACTGLTSITIPDSVTSIGSYAFSGCKGLTSVTIPDSVTSILMHAFYGCTGLKSVMIPDSVKSIEQEAFYGCTGLESIVIPDSVKSIEQEAFYGCTGLTSVTIGASVTGIGESAFCDCTGLTSVTIPDRVKEIGEHTFYYCKSLASVTIPNSVKRIGNTAFNYCESLSDVYYGGSESDRKNMSIGYSNGPLLQATWHYNYVDPNTHTHAFGTEWKFDETNHWNVCDCGEKGNVALHTFKEGVISTPATENNTGVMTYTCSICGYEKVETIPKLPHTHTFDSGTVIKPATMERDGEITYTCTVCGYQKTEVIPVVHDAHDLPETDCIRGNAANNQKSYGYRATVTFTANVPDGGSVQWYVDGQPVGNGAELTVEDKTSSYTVTVVVTSPDGAQTMDEEHVTIQNSFLDKVAWFFLHLFLPGKYKIKQ